jgi:hypothetical protein
MRTAKTRATHFEPSVASAAAALAPFFLLFGGIVPAAKVSARETAVPAVNEVIDPG